MYGTISFICSLSIELYIANIWLSALQLLYSRVYFAEQYRYVLPNFYKVNLMLHSTSFPLLQINLSCQLKEYKVTCPHCFFFFTSCPQQQGHSSGPGAAPISARAVFAAKTVRHDSSGLTNVQKGGRLDRGVSSLMKMLHTKDGLFATPNIALETPACWSLGMVLRYQQGE
jgi:hypothetical protein